jgi:hypothetical protein
VEARGSRAAHRRGDDQAADERDVAQLHQVGRQPEPLVVALDLLREQPQSAAPRTPGARRCARCRPGPTSRGAPSPSCGRSPPPRAAGRVPTARQASAARRPRRGASRARTSSAARWAPTSASSSELLASGSRRGGPCTPPRRCGTGPASDGATRERGLDAGRTCSARPGTHRDRVLRQVQAQLEQARGDVREALPHSRGGHVGEVQPHVRVASALHPRGRSRGRRRRAAPARERVHARHEPRAVERRSTAPFAARRLADQERPRRGVVQTVGWNCTNSRLPPVAGAVKPSRGRRRSPRPGSSCRGRPCRSRRWRARSRARSPAGCGASRGP